MNLTIAAQPIANVTQPDTMTGRTVLDASFLQYADAIKPGDLALINFDDKRPTAGLYVMEALERGAVAWQGCRRIERTPMGLRVDQTGRGDWQSVPDIEALGLRIVGRVERVYSPTMIAG